MFLEEKDHDKFTRKGTDLLMEMVRQNKGQNISSMCL